MEQYDCGAKIIDVFASEEKRKQFESCFAVPTAAEGEEDEVSLDLTRMDLLRECVPENRRRNSVFGLMGFIMVYIDYLDGNQPKFNHLFADLEELARKLIPSDPFPATDF
jgi:hypothetical protein